MLPCRPAVWDTNQASISSTIGMGLSTTHTQLVSAIRKLVPDSHNSQTPTVAYVATWPNLPILARTSTPTTRSSSENSHGSLLRWD